VAAYIDARRRQVGSAAADQWERPGCGVRPLPFPPVQNILRRVDERRLSGELTTRDQALKWVGMPGIDRRTGGIVGNRKPETADHQPGTEMNVRTQKKYRRLTSRLHFCTNAGSWSIHPSVPARLKNNQQQLMRPTTARNQKERHRRLHGDPLSGRNVNTRHQGAIGIFNVPVEVNGKQKGEGE
jgi:hypothetical protein